MSEDRAIASPEPAEDEFSASFELPLDVNAAHLARRAVRQVLATWHTGEELTYDAALVTSELVTNAVHHGADRVTLRVDITADDLVIAVEDGNAVLPPPVRTAGTDDEGARGLSVIAAVAADWGVEDVPGGGKRVWTRLLAHGDLLSADQGASAGIRNSSSG